METKFDAVWEIPTLDFAALQSVEGRRWVDGLDGLADEACSQWGLNLEFGGLHNGYHAVVVPAARGSEKYVLKLSWPPESIIEEELALRRWAGRGAVRLAEADTERGVLLLERLDPTRSLADVPLLAAATEAALLLGEMCVPAPTGIRTLSDAADEMAGSIESRRVLIDGTSRVWVDAALSIVQSLGPDAGTTLIHGDLHYGNVLRGDRRPWLAVDPKPLAGDPERAVAELLFTRVDELRNGEEIRQLLSVIVQTAALDRQKAAMWAFARTVDYWLWGLEQGLTVDPPRCYRVVEAIEPLLP